MFNAVHGVAVLDLRLVPAMNADKVLSVVSGYREASLAAIVVLLACLSRR